MKLINTLTIALLAFGIQTTSAQIKKNITKKDSASEPVDTTIKVTGTVKPIFSKEIKIIKGAVPQFSKDQSKPATMQNRVAYPPGGDPTDPGLPPTDPVDPIDPVDPEPSGSPEAGRTPSGIDVSASGASIFNVPFSLPPGIGKNIPGLGLSYNAQSGNGIAGYGWSISGVSAITRLSTTAFHDNRIDGVNLDANDRFALDGQRLLLKSGTYGSDGAEYQTESYSNVRIFSRGTSTYGPQYFEVWYPDGSKAYYGVDYNSRTPMEYAISYSESPVGARISYSYFQSDNTIYLSQVLYGAMGTSSAINAINFQYSYANRTEHGYVGGQAVFRDRILTSVNITGNGSNFRNYTLTHNMVTPLRYQQLTSIKESDGNGTKSFQPIYFSYGSTGDIITHSTISNLSLSGIASNNSEMVTADFTGNGSMDFLLYPKYNKTKFWAFYDMEPGSPYYQMGYEVNIGQYLEIFPATSLTWNNKILSGQGMLVVKNNGTNSYKLEEYSSGTTAPVYYQYDKVWDTAPLAPNYYSDCDYQEHQGNPLNMKFVSGDFNGDGMTDLIAVSDALTVTYERMEWYQDPWDDRASYYYCDQQFGYVGSSAYFINMDRRLTSNFTVSLGALSQSYTYGEQIYAGDYNGDGRSDILHAKNGSMYVYTMNANNTLELLWSTTNDSRIDLSKPILQGDFNGDGKLDIMFSTGFNSLFATFLSTGKSFNKFEQYEPFAYVQDTWDGTPGVERLQQHYLIANDVNGDGKADVISAQTTTTNGSAYGTIDVTLHHSTGISGYSGPLFSSGTPTSRYTNLRHNPMPIFLNPTMPNLNLEFGFMSDNSISLFNFNKDLRKEAQLASVYQDGIYHTIEYKALRNNDYQNDITFYQSGYQQSYPYVDLQDIPGFAVVSKLTRNYNGQQVSQIFGYGKAVSHYGGLGFQGFGEFIRSNWHANSSDNNRIFNISISDPQLRGAAVRNFSTKSTYINPGIKDLALTPSATSDGASLNDYISRTDQAYSTQLLSNKVFVNIPTATLTKDMLSGTFTSETSTYDSYYNATQSVSSFNGTGSKTVEVTYDNNPGAGYIGRVLTSKTTLNNGADSFSTEEEYTYSGFLPTQIKKKGNGTGWMTDNLTYDIFGNITQKTTTAPGGAQRTISMGYDATGRFMVSSTDIDGMTSTRTYDNSTGNVLTITNPFGQTLTNSYNSWGRISSSTDYLGKSTVTTYAATTAGGLSVTESNDEGGSTATYFNAFGQKIGNYIKTVLGTNLGTETEYDVYGRLTRQSEPATQGSATQWNETAYDEYGRVKQSTSFTGKVTNISYSGLSTTVNDGTKSVTTTKNAMGQVISLQDPGGTINYSYYANGNIKASDYGGITQTIEQDGWGMKTRLTDPSAGVYEYQYDGWGQQTKETTPKGVTDITYDAAGKITQKKLTGDLTLIQSDYTYNSTTRLLTSISMTNTDGNNATYSFNYDGDKRLSSAVEDNLHARFVRGYTYDSFGRISTESYEAKNKANNITATKSIELQYQNGGLLQTTLQGTGQILWKVNSLDSRGNVTQAAQGTALKNTLQYDSYGLPQQSLLENVSSTPVTLMSLGYSYDAQRGLLNNRTNSAFNWSESFTYDNLNRLTNFNDNAGNNSQDYDNRGRITDNSQLGTYSYDGNTYRQSELTLNTGANPYYQNDHPLQQISYNAFKSPVEIIEQGKERVSFQYNASLERSHMYYGDDQADKLLRRYRRHYSEDGAMEITNDLQTGKTNFVFYLGGDAYSAPAIWKEEYSGGSVQAANLYYLHRDHLGSIVMITNDQGGVIEKRQFDAWGNIVKLQDGFGNNLAAFIVLDRGYTGHEHLLGVGLIHMNGRLYDPKLHRFLSPDNFVQDPYNTQNYNRYAYAMNNPLMYTDPNGEFLWLIPALIVIAKAAIIGAAVGAISYTASVALSNGGFNNWNWGQFGKSVGFGAVSGVATAGIGAAFGNVAKFGHEVLRGLAHGVAQGGISELSGGNFLTGFASGGLGSVAGSGWQAWGGKFASSGVGMVAFSAVSGGIGAELTGGNFWQGAGVGAIVAGLNHLPEMIKQKTAWDINKDGKLSKSEADNWYLEGDGKPISVDNRKIDWSGLGMPDDTEIGKIFAISTDKAFIDLKWETASTYGGTSFRRTGENTAVVLDQAYHYNLRSNSGIKNIIRNFMNEFGKPGTAYPRSGHADAVGKQFNIHFLNPKIKFR